MSASTFGFQVTFRASPRKTHKLVFFQTFTLVTMLSLHGGVQGDQSVSFVSCGRKIGRRLGVTGIHPYRPLLYPSWWSQSERLLNV